MIKCECGWTGTEKDLVYQGPIRGEDEDEFCPNCRRSVWKRGKIHPLIEDVLERHLGV